MKRRGIVGELRVCRGLKVRGETRKMGQEVKLPIKTTIINLTHCPEHYAQESMLHSG